MQSRIQRLLSLDQSKISQQGQQNKATLPQDAQQQLSIERWDSQVNGEGSFDGMGLIGTTCV
jgi:hypothetical protein